MSQMNFKIVMEEVSNVNKASTLNELTKQKLPYLSINDNEDLYIMINIDTLDDLYVYSEHTVEIKSINQFRHINCLNEVGETTKCPFCAANIKKSYRAIIPVCVVDPNDGSKVDYKIWNPSAKLIQDLFLNNDKIKENSLINIKNTVFKLTRHGRDINGYYVYDLEPTSFLRIVDLSPLDDVDYNSYVQNKSAEEMMSFLTTGDFPRIQKNQSFQDLEMPDDIEMTDPFLGDNIGAASSLETPSQSNIDLDPFSEEAVSQRHWPGNSDFND